MSDADFDCDKSKVKVPKNQLLEAIIAEGKNLTQSFICFVEVADVVTILNAS